MRTFLDQPPSGRVGRNPKHTFRINALPFTAQPFMIAPVLVGDTLDSCYMESRVLTDSLNNPLIGMKQSYFLFYVKVSDLENTTIRDMFIDPTNTDIKATLGVAANKQWTYTAKGSIDYVERCVEAIVEKWFRDDGETMQAYATAAGVPIVQIREKTFLDSLTDVDLMPEGSAIAGATDAGDLDRLMDAFETARAMGLTNMSYEDWLRSNGINVPEKDEHKPELLYTFSDWAYPSNAVDPSTGLAVSACSWVFREGSPPKARPKFFKEPGWLVGISVCRPKVYFAGLAGNVAGFMSRAWDWLPNYMRSEPMTRLKFFDVGNTAGGGAYFGPLGDRLTDTDEYWLDMADVLNHGDQFQNVVAFPANTADPANSGTEYQFALPTGAAVNWKYPSETQCKQFFVDSAGTKFYVKHDGYMSLNIRGAGHSVDMSEARIALR